MKNLVYTIATIVFFSSLVLVPSDDAPLTTYITWLAVILVAGMVSIRKDRKHEAK